MKLCELIPSTAIGTGTGQFRPGATDADGDAITFLSGSQWKRFWYKTGVNSAVTSMHVIGTRDLWKDIQQLLWMRMILYRFW